MMEKKLKKLYKSHRENEGNIISLLQEIQAEFGYIPEDVVMWFSKKLDIPASRFFGVATFYAQFHLKPRGKNIITTCCGTACHVKGSERLLNGLVRELNLPEGDNTTPDSQFTVEKVNCVGACSIAPVVIVNDRVHGKMSADSLMKEIKKLKESESEE
ncbi:MAG: NAD(P)H-dependent oxidoreductase subunit E [Candidatus Sulfobium sp.]|jgi:NADH:ubiquinone oxidoreductase subunit E